MVFDDFSVDHVDDILRYVGGMVCDPFQTPAHDHEMDGAGDRLLVGDHVGEQFTEDLII